MDLEIIILSEISQKENSKSHTISLICRIQHKRTYLKKQVTRWPLSPFVQHSARRSRQNLLSLNLCLLNCKKERVGLIAKPPTTSSFLTLDLNDAWFLNYKLFLSQPPGKEEGWERTATSLSWREIGETEDHMSLSQAAASASDRFRCKARL